MVHVCLYIHGSVQTFTMYTHTYMYILWCHNVYLVVIPIPSIAWGTEEWHQIQTVVFVIWTSCKENTSHNKVPDWNLNITTLKHWHTLCSLIPSRSPLKYRRRREPGNEASCRIWEWGHTYLRAVFLLCVYHTCKETSRHDKWEMNQNEVPNDVINQLDIEMFAWDIKLSLYSSKYLIAQWVRGMGPC